MGRLTLNVLLSFAQFEREVIGERVRDKIAASKAKGIWVGGSVPLGYASVNKKLVVVPKDADTVRLIYRRYLELGSIRDLMEDLDRRGIRTRRQILSTGKSRGGIRFEVSSLAHLLRNRFYIGEVVYHGAVHLGEQEPILDRILFDAVQAKLTAGANVRRLKFKASPAILTGRIFDERGNGMTPSHSNKRGVMYRYYISLAILKGRHDEAGSVERVSAPEIETEVVQALRTHLDKCNSNNGQGPKTDRELIERHVDRIIVKPQAIKIHLVSASGDGPDEHDQGIAILQPAKSDSGVIISVPWTKTATEAIKGVLHSPSTSPTMSRDNRDILLTAIAKARAWIDDLVEGRVASFAEIAKQEGKVERHIRLLAPLAFVSPAKISHIIDGTAPMVRVTELAKGVTYSWN